MWRNPFDLQGCRLTLSALQDKIINHKTDAGKGLTLQGRLFLTSGGTSAVLPIAAFA
jgi:hypothetical protein